MKVTGTKTSSNETSVEIDLFEGQKLSKKAKAQVQDEVGNYLVEQTLVAMNQKKSPVDGEGNFQKLSPKYKKFKQHEVGNSNADLEFDGVMKDELEFHKTPDGIEIGVYGERAGAADGHNNLSGKSHLPTRRFLPDKGQQYTSKIQKEVDRIVADALADDVSFKRSDFRGIETKKELYDALRSIFGDDLSRAELKLAVYRNEDLTDLLNDMNLLDLL